MNPGLENLETSMYYLMFAAYLLSMFSYWVWAAFKSELMGKLATALAIVGFAANTAAIVVRILIVQRPPLTNGYEFLVTFCWGILAVYLFAEFRYRLKALGVFVLPVAFLLLAYIAMKMGPEERVAQAIPPALKSQWLTFHVITAILAYGAFAVAFGLGLMYLLKHKFELLKKSDGLMTRFPALDTLDELAYRVVGFAFPLLSLCIITGAIWANYAWGTYWSWDPKETWSLITWLIYAGYLHARLMYGWKGKRAAWMAVFGFAAVLFTFFGVNYFLPGLHTYA
ncbi:c-type cytochrome biogenesis protein CcsB [Paradesulfitobacterium ferrireducens]|uniref:c-type cytochrome biogenesis protein CcsB n=1 Tax=Paradesulfitobacterium ferrireducens TaxID=2816476 RepID=UPI001A8FDA7A|nr:c-type cytochrome biogenesis protein CcsB [Paradesulfitobacterium ferrireducens]